MVLERVRDGEKYIAGDVQLHHSVSGSRTVSRQDGFRAMITAELFPGNEARQKSPRRVTPFEALIDLFALRHDLE